MTQRKRLLGRLFLAAGLALGWSEEAAAQDDDYKLSVNPKSVREDAGPTDIEVTVEVTNDTAVEADTYVLLGVSNEGFNSRFRLTLTVLRIPAGQKKATGQLTFIPVDDEVDNRDLTITLSGNAGSSSSVAGTTITLVDDDKESRNINLSADRVELNRFDGPTEITVTATLDGKELTRATTFVLTIGDHPDLTATPNSDTDDDGDRDDGDATKDNREAQRDLDYTVMLATLTIPRNSVSGTATITITPRNRLPGTIRVESPGVRVGDDGLTIYPVDIKIKKEIAAAPDAIVLSPNRVREDAGATTIKLSVTLQEPLVEDETVNFVVLPAGSRLSEGGTVTRTPIRDVHYTLVFGPPLVIPAGAAEGTTTFTLTPIDDAAVVMRGSIYIQVAVGDVLTTKTIAIADDDANSTQIALTVDPTSISEGAGRTEVAVTGTLDGKVLDDDVLVLLTIDPDPKDADAEGNVVDVAEATRDIDYTAILRPLTIPAGAVSGTTTISITPIDDEVVDASETIRLTVPYANNQLTARGGLRLTIDPVDITLREAGEGGAPFFAASATIADWSYAVGTEIASLVLPEATGGVGDLTYRVSVLPAGLSFDAATRTISGTPADAADGAVTVIYTATDRNGNAARQTFTLTIRAAPTTVLAFAEGAAIADQTYTARTAIADLVLPEAMGGTGDLRYQVLTLLAGLSFDGATRTLSGTPTEATNCAVEVTYMVTDRNRAAAALTFSITVNALERPSVVATELAAKPAVIREDAATTQVSLTITLEAASDMDESVRFVLVDPTDGPAAVRDVDYSAELEALVVIPAGATAGTTTLALTPIDDDESEGLKALGVQATLVSTGATLVTDIEIRDDEAPSTSIWLSAEPSVLSEEAALTTVVLTATLDGKALAANATVHLSIDEASTAMRDLDYAALFTPRIEIPAGSTTGTLRFYIDPVSDNLAEGDEFIRLIGAIDGLVGGEVEIVLSDSEAAKAVVQVQPAAYALANNYPNPFNPATTIQYALPQAADVELVVYNAVGQPVRTLVAEHQHAGHYAVEWDATDDRGYSLSSGMYLYRLQAGGAFREIKKMLLLR